MKLWTALVPLKLNADSKSRLGDALTAAERIALIEGMARHVLLVLGQVEQVDRIVVLSAERPQWWLGDWARDQTGSLNCALDDWRKGEPQRQLLVIHGDLPFARPDEIAALLNAAETTGAAMATDRHGLGTNALALSGRSDFGFRFGPCSREKHAASQPCTVLDLPGLARDIDNPADLAEWRRLQSI